MATHGKRRAYGQHFLQDARLCSTLVSEFTEFSEAPRTSWLEIGPGRGALTEPLIARWREIPLSTRPKLVIVERDRSFAADWEHQISTFKADEGRLARVICADFLNVPVSDWMPDDQVAVISNLPYSAGTAILTRLAEHPTRIRGMLLMFQAEVARRLRASPGNKEWGSLSIHIQNRWSVEKRHAVPPGAFSPPPEVDSEVVLIQPREEPLVPDSLKDPQLFEKLVRLSFEHRRKMLRSCLPEQGPWREALKRSGIEGTLRAEALQWDQWRQLFQAVLAASD